ncbi:MAG: AmpG family muropeptide MFS transporter, partial [Gammaproteobacteria bacterium]|nr:AmpG family muropeptide MFS transporter [Gammaproteobacteria bacterium]
ALIGGLLGGLLIVKIGINRALWLFGVVQLVTILGFAYLAQVGSDLMVLAGVVAAEYLGVGLGTAAFVAFIARETSPLLAATQFALFSAITAVPRTLTAAATGWLVEVVGWEEFFYVCALSAVPGMLLLVWVAPFTAPIDGPGQSAAR